MTQNSAFRISSQHQKSFPDILSLNPSLQAANWFDQDITRSTIAGHVNALIDIVILRYSECSSLSLHPDNHGNDSDYKRYLLFCMLSLVLKDVAMPPEKNLFILTFGQHLQRLGCDDNVDLWIRSSISELNRYMPRMYNIA